MNELDVSLKTDVKTQKNTWIFLGALLVLLIAATINYGWYVLVITAIAFAVSLIVEFGFAKFRKQPFDRAWMVTPLLIALLMPPAIPWYIPMIAAFFAVFFGKNIFGGSGKYVFTPALVGLVFVLISFPSQMATSYMTADFNAGATPLIALNGGTDPYPFGFMGLLLGNVPGSVGESFRLGVIVLGVVLIFLKVTDWRTPVSYLVTFFVITAVFYYLFPGFVNRNGIPYGKDPFISLFVGSILFGALFLANDPVTEPEHTRARFIYGVGLALLTFIIRNFGTFPEGVVFSILIMNAVSPLIDEAFKPKASESEVKA